MDAPTAPTYDNYAAAHKVRFCLLPRQDVLRSVMRAFSFVCLFVRSFVTLVVIYRILTPIFMKFGRDALNFANFRVKTAVLTIFRS